MAQHTQARLSGKTALVTGAARRIGAAIARALHAEGAHVVIHCNHSHADAAALAAELGDGRADVLRADLRDPGACERLVQEALQCTGRLDVLVNNASTFYPTPVGRIDAEAFDDLVGSNLRAPVFLTQAAAPALREAGGSVVNLADIHGQRPLPDFPVYCSAKAGLIMLTRALARDLAPGIRVNAVAPGSILWAEGDATPDAAQQEATLAATPLGRQGSPDDIVAAVNYLLIEATFVTGQVIAIDGGRSL